MFRPGWSVSSAPECPGQVAPEEPGDEEAAERQRRRPAPTARGPAGPTTDPPIRIAWIGRLRRLAEADDLRESLPDRLVRVVEERLAPGRERLAELRDRQPPEGVRRSTIGGIAARPNAGRSAAAAPTADPAAAPRRSPAAIAGPTVRAPSGWTSDQARQARRRQQPAAEAPALQEPADDRGRPGPQRDDQQERDHPEVGVPEREVDPDVGRGTGPSPPGPRRPCRRGRGSPGRRARQDRDRAGDEQPCRPAPGSGRRRRRRTARSASPMASETALLA